MDAIVQTCNRLGITTIASVEQALTTDEAAIVSFARNWISVEHPSPESITIVTSEFHYFTDAVRIAKLVTQ